MRSAVPSPPLGRGAGVRGGRAKGIKPPLTLPSPPTAGRGLCRRFAPLQIWWLSPHKRDCFISVSRTKRVPEQLHNPFGVVACVAIVTQGSASRRNPGLKTQPRWGKQQGTMTDADPVSSRGNLPPTNQDIDKSSLPQRGYVSSPGLRRSATLGIDPNMGSQPQRGCVIVRDSPCIQRAQGFVRLR